MSNDEGRPVKPHRSGGGHWVEPFPLPLPQIRSCAPCRTSWTAPVNLCPKCGKEGSIDPLDEIIAHATNEELEPRNRLQGVIARIGKLKAARAEGLPPDVLALLKDSKRGHVYCDDSWYSCPQAEDGCSDDSKGDKCDCGADDWNARVDALLQPYMNPRP